MDCFQKNKLKQKKLEKKDPVSLLLQRGRLGFIPDTELTLRLATTEAIRRATHSQSVTEAVFYFLRYDKKSSQLRVTPTQNLAKLDSGQCGACGVSSGTGSRE